MSTTEQETIRDEKGRFKPGYSGNPGGAPKKETTFQYWMNYFKGLHPDELVNWIADNPDRCVAAEIALARVINAKNELNEFREVADRTEGKAPQTIKHEGEVDTGAREVASVLRDIIEADDSKAD